MSTLPQMYVVRMRLLQLWTLTCLSQSKSIHRHANTAQHQAEVCIASQTAFFSQKDQLKAESGASRKISKKEAKHNWRFTIRQETVTHLTSVDGPEPIGTELQQGGKGQIQADLSKTRNRDRRS